MVELQTALTFVHLVSVAFLLGGLGTQAAWKILADRTRDPRDIATVLDKLIAVDRIFTGPSALLTFASGYIVIRGLGAFGGSIGGAPWALWGLILMFVALAIWYFALRPLAIRMADMADAAEAARAGMPADYGRKSVQWLGAWSVVVGLIIVVAWLMVTKPGA